MEQKPIINSWANFLMNEKLTIDRTGDLRLIDLAMKLAEMCPPCIKSHKDKLASRALVCQVAMNMGFDLTALRARNGKMAMGRGLLDAWNKEYQIKYGSIVGTAGEHEVKRRGVSTLTASRRKTDAIT